MGFADLCFGQCPGRKKERDKSTQRILQRVRTSAFLCERRESSRAKSKEVGSVLQWGEKEQACHPVVGIWGLGSMAPSGG